MTRKGRAENLPEEIVDTVSTTAQISGKSCSTLLRTILLLKLSDEIRTIIRNPSILVVFIKEMYPRNEYQNMVATRL